MLDEDASCPSYLAVMLRVRDKLLGFGPQDGHFDICNLCNKLAERLEKGDLYEDLACRHPEVMHGRRVFKTDWGTIQ